MATRRITLQQVQIPQPCPIDWSVMAGDQQRRFCRQCGKHVHDLSALPREAAEALLATQPGLCVQILRDRRGRAWSFPRQSGWRRFAPAAMASTLLGVIMTVTGCVTRTGGEPMVAPHLRSTTQPTTAPVPPR